MTTDKKENISARRDLGHNNAVKRSHLIIDDTYIYDFDRWELADKLQEIVDKIEHKFNRCEEFLINNKENLALSYYSEDYYNGRARAFEDILDIINDTLKCKEED